MIDIVSPGLVSSITVVGSGPITLGSRSASTAIASCVGSAIAGSLGTSSTLGSSITTSSNLGGSFGSTSCTLSISERTLFIASA